MYSTDGMASCPMVKKRILVVAPHLEFPVRNGADKYISEKWSSVPHDEYEVCLIASDGTYMADGEGWSSVRRWPSRRMSRLQNVATILRFILGDQQYLSYKYANSSIAQEVSIELKQQWHLIVFSFVSTYDRYAADLQPDSRVLIESHNFDPKIYLDRAAEVWGVRRGLYSVAAARSQLSLKRLPPEVTVCALGGQDASLLRATTNAHIQIGSIGFRCKELRVVYPHSVCTPTLIFVGSLGVQMNAHAISVFVRDQWQPIKSVWPEARLKVVGSNPGRDLFKQFENQPGIDVMSNVSDERLMKELATSHCAIVPFSEANGLKLKVGSALECGVPIISSISLGNQLLEDGIAQLVGSSDEWISAITNVLEPVRQRQVAQMALAYCRRWSWRAVAEGSIIAATRSHSCQ